LRKEPASMHIPIIVISRDDSPTAHIRVRLAGANAYLAKPFTVQDILACIQPFAALPNPDSHEK
jgi:DNA-binding response OmpR family regulator